MAVTTVRDAASFLLCIKESTTTVFDSDAVEYLQNQIDAVRRGLDKMGVTDQKKREEWIYFEGMLKGTMLKLRKKAYEETQAQKARMEPKLIVVKPS